MNSVDEYIERQQPYARKRLKEIRDIFRRSVPDGTELTSYRMPALKFHGTVGYYASFSNHYSVLFRPHVLKAFKIEIRRFETTKSAVHLDYSKEVPKALISRMAKYSAAVNLHRDMSR